MNHGSKHIFSRFFKHSVVGLSEYTCECLFEQSIFLFILFFLLLCHVFFHWFFGCPFLKNILFLTNADLGLLGFQFDLHFKSVV